MFKGYRASSGNGLNRLSIGAHGMNILQCDGCSASENIAVGEYQGKKIRRVAVSIIWPSLTDTAANTYDLCESCRDRLRSMADPKKWPRPKEKAAAEPGDKRAAA